MRRKACDALCISHVYQYSGKVSKIIQNSVKFSTNFFTFIPLLAVMTGQGDSTHCVVERFIAMCLLHILSRDKSLHYAVGDVELFGEQAERLFCIGLDHLARKEHGMVSHFTPHSDKIVVVFAGDVS